MPTTSTRSPRFATPPLKRAVAWIAAFAILAASGAAQAAAGMCSAHSPAHRVALVELYSSEGCSSCPPADQWLSQFKDRGAAQDIVPLALHVDYWNSLGWTDRFSQHRFTERQQTLTDLAGGHTIYTPEVFVAGRELRSWSQRDSFASHIRAVTAEPAQASIALDLAAQAGGAFNVDARFVSDAKADANGREGGLKSGSANASVSATATGAASSSGTLNAYVAIYQNALSSQVRAGENNGAVLHHERVVRQWIGPVPLVAGHARIQHDVRPGDVDGNNNTHADADLGAVAFVENAATGEVVQATELAACH
jgi:hypothetical protein